MEEEYMDRARIRKLKDFWHEKTYGGTSLIYRLVKDKELSNIGVDLVKITKRKVLKPHYHLRPKVVIFVIEGSGFVHLNGKEQKIRKGDVITIPSKTCHGFRTMNSHLVFLSIQSPAIYGKDAIKDTYYVL